VGRALAQPRRSLRRGRARSPSRPVADSEHAERGTSPRSCGVIDVDTAPSTVYAKGQGPRLVLRHLRASSASAASCSGERPERVYSARPTGPSPGKGRNACERSAPTPTVSAVGK